MIYEEGSIHVMFRYVHWENIESATVMALTMGGYLSSANQMSRRPKRERAETQYKSEH